MIRVLIVEDELGAERELRLALESISDEVYIVTARSLEEAIPLIRDEVWDLITCDLRIPVSVGSLDASDTHGLAVHAAVEEYAPGTPEVIATGFATLDNVSKALENCRVEYVYSSRRMPLVQLTEKRKPIDQVGRLRSVIADILALDSIAVELPDGIAPSDINPMLLRAAQRYSQWMGVSAVKLIPLTGLSGASVARLELRDQNGGLVWQLLKVSSREDALEEYERYRQHLPNRLQPSAFAGNSYRFFYGLRKSGALFYTVAAPSRSIFKVLTEDVSQGGPLVVRLRENLAPWAPETKVTTNQDVGELRRSRISDVKLQDRLAREQLPGWPVMEEDLQLDIPVGTCHGDLHGGNVLVDASGNPLVIDFGDVAYGPPILDSVTLELSVIFHADGPARASGWPTAEQALNWLDLDTYLIDCPFPEFISACREWSYALAGTRAMCAMAYAHSLRQLKYDDVDAGLAMAIAKGVARGLVSDQPA